MAAKTVVRKITLRDVIGGKLDVRTLPKVGVLPLAIIYGVAHSCAIKAAPMGDYMLFNGQFQARGKFGKHVDKTFFSGKMILPNIAADLLSGALEEGASVEFAFEVGAEYDEKSATSYVYRVTPLVDHGSSQAMAALEQRIGLALPAPAPDALPTVPQEVDTQTGEIAPAAEEPKPARGRAARAA